MMNATVTLKVTPNELQIIDAALKMYAYAMIEREGRTHRLDGYQLDLSICDGDPRMAMMAAQKIRRDIGLK